MDSFNIRVAKNGYIYTPDAGDFMGGAVVDNVVVFTDPLQLIQHIRECHPVDRDSFVYIGKLIDEENHTKD